MQENTSTLEEEASKIGLVINPDKRKVTVTSTWDDRSDIRAAGSDIKLVNNR